MKKHLVIFLFLLSLSNIFSQTKQHSDCDSLQFLNFTSKYLKHHYAQNIPGYGSKLEISGNSKKNIYYFEQEHHTTWYKFSTPFDGELAITITPDSPKDDYDFLLFKISENNFCDSIKTKKLKPLRTNISRGNKTILGITGLSKDAKQEFVGQGIGDAFSKTIIVKKGENYVIVLDNVKGTEGHSIEMSYLQNIEISGVVTDENKKPVKANVTLTDNNGQEIAKTKSDTAGKYFIKAKVAESVSNKLTIENDSSFFQTIEINTAKTKDYTFRDIRTELPKLKAGKKYNIGNLNFYGNLAVLLPASIPNLEALYKIMARNKHMVIRIEGHINNPGNAVKDTPFFQKLSEDRAEVVYDYLVEKGIEKERMSKIGFGSKYMLFPNAVSEEEQEKNRRVEINVISIK
jgi:outer membrane protein OmpA-like peptidoglycan-associated protein